MWIKLRWFLVLFLAFFRLSKQILPTCTRKTNFCHFSSQKTIFSCSFLIFSNRFFSQELWTESANVQTEQESSNCRSVIHVTAEEFNVVFHVLFQEFYADYIAISAHVYSLNITNIYHQYNWIPETLNRVMQGLSSTLLALKRAPLIRYQNSSEMAHRLAERVRQLMAKESALFDFRSTGSQPVLLILDRREDAVTPLLNQVIQTNRLEVFGLVFYLKSSHPSISGVARCQAEVGTFVPNLKTPPNPYGRVCTFHMDLSSIFLC